MGALDRVLTVVEEQVLGKLGECYGAMLEEVRMTDPNKRRSIRSTMLDLVKGRLEELGWRIVAAPFSAPFTGAARRAGREVPPGYPGPEDATSSCACWVMVGSMADDLELGKSLIVRQMKRVAELEKKVDDMQLESCRSRNAD